MNEMITLKIKNKMVYKTIYSNGIYYEIRLPINLTSQSIINNLGDLRIK
jgi:hypothetical protein